VITIAARLVAAVALTVVMGAAPTRLRVVVAVGPDEASLHRERATLTCDGGDSRGTGYLEPSARATAACRVVRAGRVATIAQQQSSGRLCTQIYGGPQTARVTGSIDGRRTRLSVTRTDGCGVADWRRLGALAGDPERTR
jgi:hypothetical protein